MWMQASTAWNMRALSEVSIFTNNRFVAKNSHVYQAHFSALRRKYSKYDLATNLSHRLSRLPACHCFWNPNVPSRSFHQGTVYRTKSFQRSEIYYELFPGTLPAGPPPKGPFKINQRDLRKEFLKLQARTHPDVHTGQSKAKAQRLSALLNEAYKTLQDPLLRAQHLLKLRGIDVAEDEALKIDDAELLMEVLDAREQIEAAKTEQELEPVRTANGQRIQDSVEILDKAFQEDNIQDATEEAIKLKYWTNIDSSIREWDRERSNVLSNRQNL